MDRWQPLVTRFELDHLPGMEPSDPGQLKRVSEKCGGIFAFLTR